MKANSQTNQMLKDKIYKNIQSQRNDLKKSELTWANSLGTRSR
jgi:hypothetical protein